MKRIAIVHHVALLGGGTKSLADMAAMLCDQYEIVICVPKGEPLQVPYLGDKVSVHEMDKGVPFLNFFSGSSPLLSKSSLKSLISIMHTKAFRDEMRDLHPDLILFNTIVSSIGAYSLQGITCACIDRETMVRASHISLYTKIINKSFKGIGFLCDYEREKFSFADTVITEIIPDCVPARDLEIDCEPVQPDGDNPYRVLFMGGSSRLKGAHLVLQVAAETDPSVEIIIAGRFSTGLFSMKNIIRHFYNPKYCTDLCKMRKAYSKLQNKNNVRFIGEQKNIYPIIQQSDIVVFPSTKVHQPRPCIEAGYFAKPVIISDYAETKEFFKSGYNALVFNPNDATGLKKCIEYAKNHREEMEVMGKHNYEMSTTLHNYQMVQEKLNNWIETMMNS